MRILCYSSYYSPYLSGVTTTTEQILQNLSKRHSITVLTFRYDSSLKKIEKNGVSILRMPWIIRVSKGFISVQSLIYFFRHIQTCDVVLVNLPNAEALPLILLAKLFGKKIITLFHCDLELSGGLVAKAITKVVGTTTYLQLLLSNVIVTYPDYLSNHRYGKLFRSKLQFCFPVVNPPPPDLEYLEKLKSNKKSQIYIGFVGRVSREKGIEYLLEACAQLSSENMQYQLLFIGPSHVVGEGEYLGSIKKILSTNLVPYKFLGQLSRSELSSFYKACDVVVVPSVNKTEAISIAQMESMLMGTPVVASSLPGVRMPVQKTGMGILTKPRKSKEIASALTAILKNRSHYTDGDGLKKAKLLFDKKKVFAFYDTLFP